MAGLRAVRASGVSGNMGLRVPFATRIATAPEQACHCATACPNIHAMRRSIHFTVLLAALPLSATAERAEHAGCYATWSEREIVLGNSLFERHWTIKGGLLVASSFRDKSAGREWLRSPAPQPAPHPGGKVADDGWKLEFSAEHGRFHPVEDESLVLHLTATGKGEAFRYRFQVFPMAGGATLGFETTRKPPTMTDARKTDAAKGQPDGIEGGSAPKQGNRGPIAAAEDFLLAPVHVRYGGVELMDQTDKHDELVSENEWLPLHDNITSEGNLFHAEDPLSGDGLIFLKIAPLPHARPVKAPFDLKIAGTERRVTLGGHGYPWTVLCYRGGRPGRIAALQDYQRCLRTYVPDRDGQFLSNTWGDRSRDARVNADFLTHEIGSGARLGVDVVQVDDGWQKGKSGNSAFGKGAWGGFRKSDPEFWTPHPERFPNGLKPLVEAAREKGMKFGLWFGPDRDNDMAAWDHDARLLLDVFKKENIDYVKVDAVEVASPTAEKNLHSFYEKVLRESGGRVVFDADITAGLRPGYFGLPRVGPLFVENRYTDWHRYWPHHTLRNLWTLAPHVDPLRLRMEFLNQTRNREKYRDDPLAPAQYPPDTLFATVMFANPLGWFEVSNLPENYFQTIPPLVKAWKGERQQIFTGHIIPIGDAPDGHAWTGLASVSRDRKSARIVVFRELNPADSWTTSIPLLNRDSGNVTVLAGKGTATMNNGQLQVRIPETLQYLFLRIEPQSTR